MDERPPTLPPEASPTAGEAALGALRQLQEAGWRLDEVEDWETGRLYRVRHRRAGWADIFAPHKEHDQ